MIDKVLAGAARLGGAGLALALSASAYAGTIHLSFEEPAASSTYNGIANVRGYTFSTVPMKSVKLYVDGQYVSDLPLGGSRGDVGAAYPGNPFAAVSGFSMAFGYSNLTAGNHTFKVRAEDNDGAVNEASATFRVVRFDSSFVADPAKVSLSGASASISGNSILVNNATVDGKTYNLKLDWRTAIQGYTFSEITKVGGSQSGTCTETAKLLGAWTYTYTIVSTFVDKYKFVELSETGDPDIPCIALGYDSYGNFDTAGGYAKSSKNWVVIDFYSDFDLGYTFTFVNDSKVSGAFNLIYDDGTISNSYPMTGVRTSSSASVQGLGADVAGGDEEVVAGDVRNEADVAQVRQEEVATMDALKVRRAARAAAVGATSVSRQDLESLQHLRALVGRP